MNDAELDALAKRAAAHMRAEAQAVADSEAALAQLLAVAAGEAPQPLAPVIPYHGPLREVRRRRRRQLVAVAAAIVVLAVGIGYALVNGSGSIEVAGPPPAGSGSGPALGSTNAPSPSAPTATAPGAGSGAATPAAAPGSTTGASIAPSTTPATAAPPTPTSPVSRPASGLLVPEVRPVAADDLPYLLPQPRPPSNRSYRSEVVWDPTPPTLSQLWVRSDRDGAVDAIVHMVTRVSPAVRSSATRSLDVPGWASARAWDMAPGYVDIELAGTGEFVEIWSRGLDEATVLAIAQELRPDTSVWRSDLLDGGGWTTLQSDWSVGAVGRHLLTLDDDGDVDAELSVRRGADLLDSSVMVQLSDELQLVDVNGSPGLLGRPGASGLVFVTPDGALVEVGSRDPAADLVAVAASLVVVDVATWEAAGQPRPPDWDGCISLFC